MQPVESTYASLESAAFEEWFKLRFAAPGSWNRGEIVREAFAAGALWERYRTDQPKPNP